jgi:hypothetical protein
MLFFSFLALSLTFKSRKKNGKQYDKINIYFKCFSNSKAYALLILYTKFILTFSFSYSFSFSFSTHESTHIHFKHTNPSVLKYFCSTNIYTYTTSHPARHSLLILLYVTMSIYVPLATSHYSFSLWQMHNKLSLACFNLLHLSAHLYTFCF